MSQDHPTDAELREPGAARLGVLGKPIAHSKSPAIHAAAYGVLGLPWSYDRAELDAPELEGHLAGLGADWRGLSLTMPLKEEAARLARVIDPVAAESGVVNTLLRLTDDASGRPQWAGFNTDVAGLARAIARAGLDASATVVLGAGATAVSAVLAARTLGAGSLGAGSLGAGSLGAGSLGAESQGAQRLVIAARRPEAAAELAARFGEDVSAMTLGDSPDFDPTLVISTLPGPASETVVLPEAFLRVPLFDVAYDPWPSPLATRWRAAGGVAHAGLDMLVEQALVQIRIFVNGDPDTPLTDEESVLAAMRAASVER